MTISIIAAMAKNQVIGKEGKLPWKLGPDMKRFRELTIGKPVIMGRKTFESIGKALAGRVNIILTKRHDYQAADCIVTHSLEDALRAAGTGGNRADASLPPKPPEIMVIGGAEVYNLFLPHAKQMYLTYIHHEFEGDAFFPAFDPAEWQEITRQDFKADAQSPYSYSFVILERKR